MLNQMRTVGQAYGVIENQAQRAAVRNSAALGMISEGFTAATAAVAAFSIKYGSQVMESENLSGRVFGNMRGDVEKWSRGMEKASSLNEFEARRQAGVFFNLATSLKLPREEALKMSKNLTQLAVDLSSFHDIPIDRAMQNIASGLIGNTRAMYGYGVSLDASTLKTAAYTTGIAAQGSELSKQQKVLAAYYEMMRQTESAHGDFAKSFPSSAANQSRLMMQQLRKELALTGIAMQDLLFGALRMGRDVLPMVTGLVKAFSRMPSEVQAVGLAAGLAVGPMMRFNMAMYQAQMSSGMFQGGVTKFLLQPKRVAMTAAVLGATYLGARYFSGKHKEEEQAQAAQHPELAPRTNTDISRDTSRMFMDAGREEVARRGANNFPGARARQLRLAPQAQRLNEDSGDDSGEGEPLDISSFSGKGLPDAGMPGNQVDFRGWRAEGGGTEKGKAYVIGEKGPELFVPKEDGTVVPNHHMSVLKNIVGKSAQEGRPVMGQRAGGGTVERNRAYLVGENGEEGYISNKDKNIIPNITGVAPGILGIRPQMRLPDNTVDSPAIRPSTTPSVPTTGVGSGTSVIPRNTSYVPPALPDLSSSTKRYDEAVHNTNGLIGALNPDGTVNQDVLDRRMRENNAEEMRRRLFEAPAGVDPALERILTLNHPEAESAKTDAERKRFLEDNKAYLDATYGGKVRKDSVKQMAKESEMTAKEVTAARSMSFIMSMGAIREVGNQDYMRAGYRLGSESVHPDIPNVAFGIGAHGGAAPAHVMDVVSRKQGGLPYLSNIFGGHSMHNLKQGDASMEGIPSEMVYGTPRMSVSDAFTEYNKNPLSGEVSAPLNIANAQAINYNFGQYTQLPEEHYMAIAEDFHSYLGLKPGDIDRHRANPDLFESETDPANRPVTVNENDKYHNVRKVYRRMIEANDGKSPMNLGNLKSALALRQKFASDPSVTSPIPSRDLITPVGEGGKYTYDPSVAQINRTSGEARKESKPFRDAPEEVGTALMARLTQDDSPFYYTTEMNKRHSLSVHHMTPDADNSEYKASKLLIGESGLNSDISSRPIVNSRGISENEYDNSYARIKNQQFEEGDFGQLLKSKTRTGALTTHAMIGHLAADGKLRDDYGKDLLRHMGTNEPVMAQLRAKSGQGRVDDLLARIEEAKAAKDLVTDTHRAERENLPISEGNLHRPGTADQAGKLGGSKYARELAKAIALSQGKDVPSSRGSYAGLSPIDALVEYTERRKQGLGPNLNQVGAGNDITTSAIGRHLLASENNREAMERIGVTAGAGYLLTKNKGQFSNISDHITDIGQIGGSRSGISRIENSYEGTSLYDRNVQDVGFAQPIKYGKTQWLPFENSKAYKTSIGHNIPQDVLNSYDDTRVRRTLQDPNQFFKQNSTVNSSAQASSQHTEDISQHIRPGEHEIYQQHLEDVRREFPLLSQFKDEALVNGQVSTTLLNKHALGRMGVNLQTSGENFLRLRNDFTSNKRDNVWTPEKKAQMAEEWERLKADDVNNIVTHSKSLSSEFGGDQDKMRAAARDLSMYSQAEPVVDALNNSSLRGNSRNALANEVANRNMDEVVNRHGIGFKPSTMQVNNEGRAALGSFGSSFAGAASFVTGLPIKPAYDALVNRMKGPSDIDRLVNDPNAQVTPVSAADRKIHEDLLKKQTTGEKLTSGEQRQVSEIGKGIAENELKLAADNVRKFSEALTNARTQITTATAAIKAHQEALPAASGTPRQAEITAQIAQQRRDLASAKRDREKAQAGLDRANIAVNTGKEILGGGPSAGRPIRLPHGLTLDQMERGNLSAMGRDISAPKAGAISTLLGIESQDRMDGIPSIERGMVLNPNGMVGPAGISHGNATGVTVADQDYVNALGGGEVNSLHTHGASTTQLSGTDLDSFVEQAQVNPRFRLNASTMGEGVDGARLNQFFATSQNYERLSPEDKTQAGGILSSEYDKHFQTLAKEAFITNGMDKTAVDAMGPTDIESNKGSLSEAQARNISSETLRRTFGVGNAKPTAEQQTLRQNFGVYTEEFDRRGRLQIQDNDLSRVSLDAQGLSRNSTDIAAHLGTRMGGQSLLDTILPQQASGTMNARYAANEERLRGSGIFKGLFAASDRLDVTKDRHNAYDEYQTHQNRYDQMLKEQGEWTPSAETPNEPHTFEARVEQSAKADASFQKFDELNNRQKEVGRLRLRDVFTDNRAVNNKLLGGAAFAETHGMKGFDLGFVGSQLVESGMRAQGADENSVHDAGLRTNVGLTVAGTAASAFQGSEGTLANSRYTKDIYSSLQQKAGSGMMGSFLENGTSSRFNMAMDRVMGGGISIGQEGKYVTGVGGALFGTKAGVSSTGAEVEGSRGLFGGMIKGGQEGVNEYRTMAGEAGMRTGMMDRFGSRVEGSVRGMGASFAENGGQLHLGAMDALLGAGTGISSYMQIRKNKDELAAAGGDAVTTSDRMDTALTATGMGASVVGAGMVGKSFGNTIVNNATRNATNTALKGGASAIEAESAGAVAGAAKGALGGAVGMGVITAAIGAVTFGMQNINSEQRNNLLQLRLQNATTREQTQLLAQGLGDANDEARSMASNIGSTAGAILGGAIGSVGGTPGMIAGSMIGGYVGGMVGEATLADPISRSFTGKSINENDQEAANMNQMQAAIDLRGQQKAQAYQTGLQGDDSYQYGAGKYAVSLTTESSSLGYNQNLIRQQQNSVGGGNIVQEYGAANGTYATKAEDIDPNKVYVDDGGNPTSVMGQQLAGNAQVYRGGQALKTNDFLKTGDKFEAGYGTKYDPTTAINKGGVGGGFHGAAAGAHNLGAAGYNAGLNIANTLTGGSDASGIIGVPLGAIMGGVGEVAGAFSGMFGFSGSDTMEVGAPTGDELKARQQKILGAKGATKNTQTAAQQLAAGDAERQKRNAEAVQGHDNSMYNHLLATGSSSAGEADVQQDIIKTKGVDAWLKLYDKNDGQTYEDKVKQLYPNGTSPAANTPGSLYQQPAMNAPQLPFGTSTIGYPQAMPGSGVSPVTNAGVNYPGSTNVPGPTPTFHVAKQNNPDYLVNINITPKNTAIQNAATDH